MKNRIEESYIVESMKKEYKKTKNFTYQLYYSCKKCCDAYGIEQLNHAKAYLEQRRKSNSDVISCWLGILSIIGIIATLIAAKANNIRNLEFLDLFLMLSLYSMLVMMVVIISSNVKKKDDYFYSIICDEIERRNNECQHK